MRFSDRNQSQVMQAQYEQFSQQQRQENEQIKAQIQQSISQSQESLNKQMHQVSQTLSQQLTQIATLQQTQLEGVLKQVQQLTESNDRKLEQVRGTIQSRLEKLQSDNNQKLEQMRQTVDEKLHESLEKRLGESFKLVSERLEVVHKGLGEMQHLASGVGDLKRVLSNVKTRGIWGEIQLGALLEQLLAREQYEKDVRTHSKSTDRVEYAVKLPGQDDQCVWLPIDAKFPQEAYLKLLDAQEKADAAACLAAGKELETAIKVEAKKIQDKYVDPPQTTDFAILFLPIEGLYAEVLRRVELQNTLQNQYRIMIAGPTTLAALLNSLQLGFRTLAIEKRSSEVWQVLGGVKSEFGKFGDLLDKTHKKLIEAGNTIETASRKTRTIERKLRDVEVLPSQASNPVPLFDVPAQ